MAKQRISKRAIDKLTPPPAGERVLWDGALSGFGVRLRATGAKSYIVAYRAGSGRAAPTRRYTIGAVGKLTPIAARKRAQSILAAVANGRDPVSERAVERATPTVAELADLFMAEHVERKRKRGTVGFYRDILDRIVKSAFGSTKADKLTRAAVSRKHGQMEGTPFQANRMLAVIGSMYTFGGKRGLLPEGFSPARGVEKFKEHRRERYLTKDELSQLGRAIHTAEITGLAWEVEEATPMAKHLPPPESRFTKIDPFAAAALRLLLFTGCRLREILHLKWENVDLQRALLFLSDSKTGRKTITLNAPAMMVLSQLSRIGVYVIAGDSAGADDEKPRADLKRPWAAIAKHAGLQGVRLHDLRHTFASVGAGSGIGLPIIGKLLGHTHAATTARYAHVDADPLRRASDVIGSHIVKAIGEGPPKPANDEAALSANKSTVTACS